MSDEIGLIFSSPFTVTISRVTINTGLTRSILSYPIVGVPERYTCAVEQGVLVPSSFSDGPSAEIRAVIFSFASSGDEIVMSWSERNVSQLAELILMSK